VSDPGFLGLVRQHLSSVWALELLLLMRSRPGEGWRPEALVRELRASPPLIADNLQRLNASGFVVFDEGLWRFAPASEALSRFCDDLAEAYRTRPVTVINLELPDPAHGRRRPVPGRQRDLRPAAG
jgi:hypothetical protein